jgi:predicted enzyme related to lactoylglutathione lyase
MTPSSAFAERLLGTIREELGMTTTTTGLRELYYTTITVTDLDRARSFFNRLFGWTFGEGHHDGDHHYIHIETYVPMGLNDDPDTANVWFAADDFDDALAKVTELGGSYVVDPSGDSAVCTDDQGVRFGLAKTTHGPLEPLGRIPEGNPSYVTIDVPDEVRGRRFYGALLGWQYEGGLANPGFATVPMGLGRGTGGRSVFIKVADPDAKAAEVRTLGGTAGERQEWPSGAGIECTDDQGTRFWLYKPAPGY